MSTGRWLCHEQPDLVAHEAVVVAARPGAVVLDRTAAHVLNALVFERFAGALVTGAQIGTDGTARIDFDLPEVANDAVRALEPEVNAVIRRGLAVRRIRYALEG